MDFDVIKAMSPAMQRSYGALLLQDRLANITSGEWQPQGAASHDIRFARTIHCSDGEVAKVCSFSSSRESEALANAQLIAAAPKLAKAAFLALSLLCDRFPHEHGSPEVGVAWGALDEALRAAFA